MVKCIFSRCYWSWTRFTECQYVVCIDEKAADPFFDDWWHFSGYDGEHCFVSFVSCSCGNSLLVRWCTTSLPPLRLCLSGQGVSWSFDRKVGPIPCLAFFYRFLFSGFFLLRACVRHCSSVQNVSELRDRIVRTAECVNQWNACHWQETEYHIDVVPPVVPILRATDHIRSLVRFSVC
jgi:hypothetical protein